VTGLVLEGRDATGDLVLNSVVRDTVTEGQACDSIRQCPGLARVTLRLIPGEAASASSADQELGLLDAWVRSSWMIVRSLSGLAQHRGAEVVIEIPEHDSPLTEGVVSFWSAMRTAGVPIDRITRY
jgi:hypothetical protein